MNIGKGWYRLAVVLTTTYLLLAGVIVWMQQREITQQAVYAQQHNDQWWLQDRMADAPPLLLDHAVFATLPIALIWFGCAGAGWIVAGFRPAKS